MPTYNARHHTLILIKDFLQSVQQGFPFDQNPLPEDEASFMELSHRLVQALEDSDADAVFDGQNWLARLFRNFPTVAPYLGREVLWYFGGEVLHFMPDEEIAKFQQLEDEMAEGGEGFDYLAAKKAIFMK